MINLQRFNGWYPFNPTLGQQMQTNVEGVEVDAAYMAHIQISAANAIAATVNTVHAAFATSADSLTTVITAITNPGCPKNLVITAGGVDADVKAVQVVVTGTNYLDEVITETFPAFTVNTLGAVVGNKAFKTVTKIEVPAMDGAGVTIAVGVGEKLGLPYLLSHNTIVKSYLNNVLEGTAATVTVSATAIESNTIDLNSALDGHVVDIYLMV